MLGDSRLCIISCIRQPVAQKLNKIHVLVYIRASFVDILREKVSYRTVSTRLRDWTCVGVHQKGVNIKSAITMTAAMTPCSTAILAEKRVLQILHL